MPKPYHRSGTVVPSLITPQALLGSEVKPLKRAVERRTPAVALTHHVPGTAPTEKQSPTFLVLSLPPGFTMAVVQLTYVAVNLESQ